MDNFQNKELHPLLQRVKDWVERPKEETYTAEDMIDFAYWVDWANEKMLEDWIKEGKPKRPKDNG